MASCWIFIIFLISFGLTNTTFAEPDDVEIDWIIEGQITTSQSEINIESSVENDSIFEKQIINFLSPKNEISDDVVEDYLTGSGYTFGGHEISIDSKEGQLLNRLLIEQRTRVWIVVDPAGFSARTTVCGWSPVTLTVFTYPAHDGR